MSLNATVQRLVDDLFADKLVAGLEATEKITWVSKDSAGYSPVTGEVTQSESHQEISVITGDFQASFPSGISSGDRRDSLAGEDGMTLQMQPLEGRTSKQALADSFIHEERTYSVKSVDVIRLGNRPMLWKVRGS
jgi:hypothetical protein